MNIRCLDTFVCLFLNFTKIPSKKRVLIPLLYRNQKPPGRTMISTQVVLSIQRLSPLYRYHLDPDRVLWKLETVTCSGKFSWSLSGVEIDEMSTKKRIRSIVGIRHL